MTTATGQAPGTARVGGRAPWTLVLQAAAALAASMGIGRFAYTPILPLMHSQAGLSAQYGSALATVNYVGYLAGALLGIVMPAVTRSVLALRAALVLVVATLALMGATENHAAWLALRLVAGIASALVFMIAVSALLTGLRGPRQHLSGWGFGGVGAGIALSGVVVLAAGTWRTAWLASAGLALLLTVAAWPLRPEPRPVRHAQPGAARPVLAPPPARRWFAVLLPSYSLEGVGYIIAGTFLVAAISENYPPGRAAGPGCSPGSPPSRPRPSGPTSARRWRRSTLLCAALLIQAAGIALPALVSGVVPALLSAVLFGATFLGVASMALALGVQLRYPRAVALLTTGYGLGQILGPLVVTPLLHHGYHLALLVAAGVVLAAALAAAVLRMGPS